MDVRVLATEKRRIIAQRMSMNCNRRRPSGYGRDWLSARITVASPFATNQRNTSLTDTVWLRSIQRTSTRPAASRLLEMPSSGNLIYPTGPGPQGN